MSDEYPTYQDYADETEADFCDNFCAKAEDCTHKGKGKCNQYEEAA
jgi:hypothetical protein